MDRDQIIEVERVGAEEERLLVGVLAEQDPSWGSMVFSVADGWAVLAGPGLFVNQVLGAGLTEPISAYDVEHVVEHAAEVEVPAVFEFCDATRFDSVDLLRDRGWTPGDSRVVVVHDFESIPPMADGIDVDLIDADDLATWQTSSALGWGHSEERAVAANDSIAAAAFVTDDPGLPLARDATDGRPIACATLRITDGIATLGGMSTRPDERRRGAQSSLIAWRLRHAAEHGCRYAVSMTQAGSDSERNLRRLGFDLAYTKTEWVQA